LTRPKLVTKWVLGARLGPATQRRASRATASALAAPTCSRPEEKSHYLVLVPCGPLTVKFMWRSFHALDLTGVENDSAPKLPVVWAYVLALAASGTTI
jgi:hypothetical protein